MTKLRKKDLDAAASLIESAQSILLDLNRVVEDLTATLKVSGTDEYPTDLTTPLLPPRPQPRRR